jgi:vacuolar protein sorting-associated protein 13A/C
MLFYLTFSRLETYDTNIHQPSKLGKRVRVAATNTLNINVSAANLDTFAGSILSWRRQLELEKKATKLIEVLILS